MPKRKPDIEHSVTQVPEDSPEKKEPGTLACPPEEAERHLRAFISAFVLPNVQPRWLDLLIDRRSEWDSPLPETRPSSRRIKIAHKVWHTFIIEAVDPRYRRKIPSGQRVASVFEAEVGKGYGVYYCPGEPPCRRTAVDANERLYENDSNALLSFAAGKQVLFFAHSDGVWVCHKP